MCISLVKKNFFLREKKVIMQGSYTLEKRYLPLAGDVKIDDLAFRVLHFVLCVKEKELLYSYLEKKK
jgi:hypothetical protein